MTTKTFPLGTVLSITTGCLLAPNGISGVYEILNFMTGDNLYTHQIPRVCRECAPYLLKQFPQLAGIDTSAVTPENVQAFLEDLLARLPAELEVETMPPGEHYEIDPMSELAEMVHPSKIVVVKVGGGDA
jgi:hypothetical protein